MSYELMFLGILGIMFTGTFLLRSRDMARENKVTFKEGLFLCGIDFVTAFWTKVLAPGLTIAILVLIAWLYINAGPNVIDYEMYRR